MVRGMVKEERGEEGGEKVMGGERGKRSGGRCTGCPVLVT